MPRGKLRTELWWDEKLSAGKSPKQIVSIIGKDFLFTESDVKQILTRLLVLKDKEFFGKRRTTDAVLACTFLCANTWMMGREPVSPHKFVKICKKNKISVTYSSLMRNVRNAKHAGHFKSGKSCSEIIAKYRNRMIYKYGLSEEFLNEVTELVSNEKTSDVIGGTNPFAAAAGMLFYHAKKNGERISQDQLSEFFGVTNVTIRNFRAKYLEIVNS